MIEPISLLHQIELLVEKAKQNPTDTNVREQLTAVRALCDVVLQSPSTSNASTYNPSATFVQTGVQDQRTLPKRKDIEQQSDSIFDF